MTWEEYWLGNDVGELLAAIEADRYRREQRNFEYWLQGNYFFDALSIAIGNMGRQKGKQPEKYLKEPYPIWQREKTPEEKEAEAIAERQKARDFFDNLVKAGKERKKQREGESAPSTSQ